MTSKKAQFKFNLGDRVAERPKNHGMLATRAEVQDVIIKNRFQRYGTVVEVFDKRIANGRIQKMLRIQWDHLKSPMDHAQMRICPIEELQTLTKQFIVSGE